VTRSRRLGTGERPGEGPHTTGLALRAAEGSQSILDKTVAVRVRIANLVFDAPFTSLIDYGERAQSIARIYADLLGLAVITRADFYRSMGYPADDGDAYDCLVRNPAGPSIAFEPVHGPYQHVHWPDPDRPAQMHVDIAVPDLADAHRRVLDRGAEVLLEADDHRSYADPVGHPFCLYPGANGAAGRIRRVVFDCFSPRSLAGFYRSFTGADRTVADTCKWVEIAFSDGSLPSLGFRHVLHVPPRWPDPTRPQQMHVDYAVVGHGATLADNVVELGAMRLTQHEGGHVYADPAGHPFCLCAP
jgi:hypothetical protein